MLYSTYLLLYIMVQSDILLRESYDSRFLNLICDVVQSKLKNTCSSIIMMMSGPEFSFYPPFPFPFFSCCKLFFKKNSCSFYFIVHFFSFLIYIYICEKAPIMIFSSPSTYQFKRSKHYYTQYNRHEQSIDVYQQTTSASIDEIASNDDRTVLILVMGSGWIGHQRWVHATTNWWNSQCPTSICGRLGYTCITIRHSGGFFHVKTLTALAIVLCLLQPAYAYLWLLAWLILYIQGRGAASIHDMLQDVGSAFDYISDNASNLGLDKDCKFVVGGYSSGAHLAATYMSKQKQLTDERIIGILHLSGMLGLNCWAINVVTMIVFGKWTWELPSPLDLIENSPIQSVPHLLIGCEYEFFGIPFLDGAFPSEEYAEKLRPGNSLSRCILVPSNHWTMLSCQALTDALEEHIPLVFNGRRKKNGKSLNAQESCQGAVSNISDSSRGTGSTYSDLTESSELSS